MTPLWVFRGWPSILASAWLFRNLNTTSLVNNSAKYKPVLPPEILLDTRDGHFRLHYVSTPPPQTPKSTCPSLHSLNPSSHLLQQVHWQKLFYISFLEVARNRKQHRYPLTEGWIKKTCYVYTTEYYLEKQNKSNNKWQEMCRQIDVTRKNTILCETIPAEKGNMVHIHL